MLFPKLKIEANRTAIASIITCIFMLHEKTEAKTAAIASISACIFIIRLSPKRPTLKKASLNRGTPSSSLFDPVTVSIEAVILTVDLQCLALCVPA